MKKSIGFLFCAALMLVACNEANAEKKAAPAAEPAAAAPAPAPAPAQAPEAPKSQIKNVDWAKALEMQQAGALLIDVRTANEVAEGTAPGAINIPLQEAGRRLAEFPKDKDLLIFCRSGKRSLAATNILMQNGYERVYNVVGGFLAFPKN